MPAPLAAVSVEARWKSSEPVVVEMKKKVWFINVLLAPLGVSDESVELFVELDEKEPLPQLIIIDGGKGQLSSTMKSINKLELADKITVIGIAKRLEEIYFPGDSIPLYINKKSESLKLIQHLRNEAHRFAITFHRNQRSKDFTKSRKRTI